MPSSSNQQGLSALSTIPPIRSFQLDTTGINHAADTVNLFRGEVNVPITLLTLPGIAGLNASVSIMYESSNVREEATTWNKDAPTGLLGLGWQLNTEKITIQNNTSGYEGQFNYFYVNGNSPNRLFQLNTTPSQDTLGDYFAFELESYEFWDIRYYPKTETWIITKENGSKSIFGGNEDIQYLQQGVIWGYDKNPNWIGSSKETDGQSQYVTDWNLKAVQNTWGDQISFNYDYDNISIGNDGKEYTRNSRVKSIVGVFGRVMVFNYGEKNPFEYSPPHAPPPSGQPPVFQDRFDKYVLQNITLYQTQKDATGATNPIQTICFEYDFMNFAGNSNDDFQKRLLSNIITQNAQGESLPGLIFSYCQNDETHNATGKLHQITYPHGGQVTYRYQEITLPGVSNYFAGDNLQIQGAIRAWFGETTTVIINNNNGDLGLFICEWNGAWRINSNFNLSNNFSGNIESLQVVIEKDYFAVSYIDNGNVVLKIFIKDQNEFNSWILDPNNYSWSLNGQNQYSILEGGNQFILLAASGISPQLLVWSPLSRTFVNQASALGFNFDAPAQFAIATHNNYFAIAYTEQSSGTELNLFYIEEYSGVIKDNGAGAIKQFFNQSFSQAVTKDTYQSFWSLGDFWAVAVDNTANNNDTFSQLIIQWNNQFKNVKTYSNQVANSIGNTTLPNGDFNTQIASSAMMDQMGNMYRFKGGDQSIENFSEAIVQKNITENYDPTTAQYRLDNDMLLAFSPNASSANLYIYDPYQEQWNAPQFDQPNNIGDFSPTISGNFFTIGTHFYYRKNNDTISSLSTNIQQAQAGSLVNFAPNYLAYQDQGQTQILLVKNGQLELPQSFGNPFFDPKAQGSGTSMAGPSVIITFSGNSLDDVSGINLIKVVNNSVGKQAIAYPATALLVDDGFETMTTLFNYEVNDENGNPYLAAKGTYALVNQFSGVEVIKGSTSTSETPFGKTLQLYFNGLISKDNSQASSQFLNGMLAQKKIYDSANTLIQTSQTEYKIIDYIFDLNSTADCKINSQSTKPSSGITNLYGGYVKPVLQSSSEFLKSIQPNSSSEANDLIPMASSSYTTYCGKTGMVMNLKNSYLNLENQEKWDKEYMTHAWEVYPDLANAHIWSPVVQTVKKVGSQQADDPSDVIIAASVKTWTTWNLSGNTLSPDSKINPNNLWGAYQTFVAQTATSLEVGDSGWLPASPPASDDWVNTSQVLTRNKTGDIIESADVEKLRTFELYSEDGQYPIAQFVNARCLEVAYLGFESYENTNDWSLQGSSSSIADLIQKGNANSGFYSLKLPTNASFGNYVNPPSTTGDTFIFFAWIKASQNNQEDISFTVNGKSQPLTGLNETWQFFHIPVTGGKSVINFTVANNSKADIYIDCIGFVPLLGGVHVNVYDPRHRSILAKLDHTGAIIRHVKDRFHRSYSLVGPAENVNGLQAHHLQRQFTQENTNNFELAVGAQNGGSYESFLTGSSLPDNWSTNGAWQTFFNDPTALSSNKVPLGGSLLHQKSSSSETIQYSATGSLTNYGVRMEIFPNTSSGVPENDITLNLGNITIQYSPSQGGWLFNKNSVVKKPFGKDWLFVLTNSAVLFFADGQQIVAQSYSDYQAGDLKISAQDEIYIHNFTTVQTPSISMTFSDGLGKAHQHHALDEQRILVSAIVYDELGRKIVSSKTGSYELANPLFQFQQNFINYDTQAFTASGDLVNQYNGQNGFSNDEGFPFSSVHFEASPLNRVSQVGAAGKPFAVLPNNGNVHVSSKNYGTSAGADFLGAVTLPKGGFSIVETTGPDGGQSYHVANQRGQQILAAVQVNNNGLYQISQNEYDAAGRIVTVFSPNYFPNKTARWQTNFAYDFLGRTTSVTSPNTKGGSTWDTAGTSTFIYDIAGRLRFFQDPRRAANKQVLYKKYDVLGRLIEEGWFGYTGQWSDLQKQASDPSYPSTGNTWVRQNIYDGDGTEAQLFGELWKSQRSSAGNTVDVMEEFDYDHQGRTNNIALTVNAFDAEPKVVKRVFDNAGNVTQLNYPKGSPVEAVNFQYNNIGQLTGIGTPNSPNQFASYGYNAIGKIANTKINPNGKMPLGQTNSFTSKNAFQNQNNNIASNPAFFSETLKYNNPTSGTPYFNGKISEKNIDLDGTQLKGLGDGVDYQLSYDQSGRLLTANTADASKSLQINSYDNNGNRLKSTLGTTEDTYAYDNNNDQLTQVSGGNNTSFSYDENGNALSAKAKGISKISYQPVISRVKEMDFGNNQNLQFQYDARKNRVLKTVSQDSKASSTKLYIRGLNSYPIVEQVKETNANLQYIYGPQGIVAMMDGTNTYYFIKDHLGSSNIVVNQNNELVAAFDYMPFGDLSNTPTGSNPDLITYRFTGQEYDSETGLHNYRARFYDSQVGRFMAVDPQHQFFSPYIYGNNDPILFIDPTGEYSFWHKFAEGIIGAFSVLAGLVVTVVTDGALGSTIGGALIGGGVSGIEDAAEDKSWKDFGIDYGIGVASGLVAGGIGGLGSVASNAIEAGVEGVAGKALGAIVGNGLIGGAGGGFTASFGSSIAKQAIYNHGHINFGAAAKSAAISAAIGFGAASIGAGLSKGFGSASDDLNEARTGAKSALKDFVQANNIKNGFLDADSPVPDSINDLVENSRADLVTADQELEDEKIKFRKFKRAWMNDDRFNAKSGFARFGTGAGYLGLTRIFSSAFRNGLHPAFDPNLNKKFKGF